MFFFLSGYTYTKKNETFKVFISKKAKSLLQPYFCFNFILLGIYILTRFPELPWKRLLVSVFGIFYSRHSIFPSGTDNNIFLFSLFNSPLWFLTAIFVAFVIFYFALKYIHGAWSGLVAAAALLGISQLMSSCPILLPWSIDTAFLCAAFMLAGLMLKQIISSQKMNQSLMLFVSLVLFIAFYCLGGGANLSIRAYNDNNCFFYFVTGVTGSMSFIVLSSFIEKTGGFFPKIMSYIGEKSIVILAFHLVVFDFIEKIIAFNQIDLSVLIKRLVCSYIETGVTLVCCLILAALFNKYCPFVLGKAEIPFLKKESYDCKK